MIRIAAIQFKPFFKNIEENIKKIDREFSSCFNNQLIVLPELASTGYHFENKEEAFICSEEISKSKYVDFLVEKAQNNGCYIVSGINERDGDSLYNSSVLIGREGVVGVYRKIHLFKNEKNLFTPGDQLPKVYQTSIGAIGMLICFDWMFPEVWRILAIQGAEVICHPSNLVLPYCQSVMPSYALVNKVFTVTANRAGVERDLTFTGQSTICSPTGSVVIDASSNKEEVIECEVDFSLSKNKMITEENHLIDDRRSDIYGNFGL